MEYSAELKTVLKWEKELKYSFTKEIKNRKVVSVKCDLCVEYVSQHKFCASIEVEYPTMLPKLVLYCTCIIFLMRNNDHEAQTRQKYF